MSGEEREVRSERDDLEIDSQATESNYHSTLNTQH